MSKEQAKEKLKSLKKKLKDDAEKLEGLGDKFDESDNRLLGPQDDIEHQKMKKDIKDSGDE